MARPIEPLKNSSPSRLARNKRRELRWLKRRELSFELKELFNSAFEDKESCEKISLLTSASLDVERGEVLASPRYHRSFRF
jgi:hypothetical protein